MKRARRAAKAALARAQRRQAEQYNKRRARGGAPFRVGDQVWCCKPSHGGDISKLRHPQRGPPVILEDLGFDNVRVKELKNDEEYMCHVSRLTSYQSSDRVRAVLTREWALIDSQDNEHSEQVLLDEDEADAVCLPLDT